MSYQPTAHLKWFPCASPDDVPFANRYQGADFDKMPYCLKQLWISDAVGEPDEWRDVEISK